MNQQKDVAAATREGDALLGRRAAEAIFTAGLKADYERRTSATFAQHAVKRLGELLASGLVQEMVEGAKQGAEALNVEAFHGIVEVVQNAEDQGAREVRLGIAEDGPDQVLLLVHNGSPVELHQLVAMSFAFLSTKRDDAQATGRFGVGLKTLFRIATDLEIHCAPFHVEVETAGPRTIRAAKDIPGFYRRADGDTLLRLRLARDFRWGDLEAWFGGLGSDLLLFLNNVATLRLIDLRPAKAKVLGAYVVRRSKATSLTLEKGSGELAARRVVVRDSQRREWIRISAQIPVPRDLWRKNKATGPTTEIAVAVQPGGASGRIFAGLPLRVQPGLPIAINAQFDPDTARLTLQEGEWNHWVLRRIMDLLQGIVRLEGKERPADLWRWVPMLGETAVPGQAWLTAELEKAVEGLQRSLRRRLTIRSGGSQMRLAELSYEHEALNGLVSEGEVGRLRPERRPLSVSARDASRWRAVLRELGGAELIDVATAVEMFAWPDMRPPEWYVGLASAALGASLSLFGCRCVLRSDGTPIVPPRAQSSEILVLDASASRAAVALGLAVPIHPIYSSAEAGAAGVRQWLERNSVLRTAASGRDALSSLMRREQPLAVTDEQLLVLRDVLFSELKPDERKGTGGRVGAVVLVEGYEFDAGARRGSKAHRRRILVSPAAAYLPASIDATGKLSWPTAAGSVAGLRWIAGRYRDVLATEGDTPGARALFTVLGAAVTPRLIERGLPELRHGWPAFPRLGDAGRLQHDAVARLAGWATHIKDERVSPDLDRVVEDLVAMAVRARRDRARALLATIGEHWRNDFADAAEVQACHSSYTWVDNGAVPAAWLSRLASAPWLSNQRNQPMAPMDLAIHTQRAVDVFGADPSIYGFELGAVQPRHYAALEAMGVTIEPKVSDIIEALKDLRSQDPDAARVTSLRAAALYDILADNCTVLDGELRPDDLIGDMSVRAVRTAFGVAKAKGKGLIVAGGAWWSPQMVFRGRPIFGTRRAFVPERKRADRLWEALNVARPGVGDCVEVLREIATHPLRDDEVGVLVDTYRHLATLAPRDRTEREALFGLPLWGGAEWITERPVFAVDDPQVSAALAQHEPTWFSPVPVGTLGDLPDRLGVTVLSLGLFSAVGVDGAAIGHGARVNAQYRRAVQHLYARFARSDVTAFEHLRPGWKMLEEAQTAIAADLGIEIRIRGRQEFTVPVAAHVHQSAGRLIIAARSEAEIGREAGGGRAIALLFGDDGSERDVDREKIALAWSAAWSDAASGLPADRLLLAEDQDSGEPDPLEGLQEDVRQAQAWRTSTNVLSRSPKRGKVPDDGGGPIEQSGPEGPPAAQAPIAMRNLKRIEDLVIGEATLNSGSTSSKAGRKRGRLAQPPAARGGNEQTPAGPGSLLRGYSDTDRERLAIAILRRILETDKRTMRDLRKVANLGADVVDNMDKFFEIKASAGEMPDVVTLQYSELERSLERPSGHWFLVVIAGLEQGFETKVRFIADPLKHLAWQDHGSVSLSGVRTVRAVEIALLTANG
jgi:hypothetical protein